MNQNLSLPCIVILTALPLEYQAVRAHLSNLHEERHPSGTLYESGLFLSGKASWRVVLAETGVGNVGAAVEAERAMNHFLPHYIFLVGVAGGLKDVRLGDIVVATKIYSYESGKANTSFQARPDIGIASYKMIQRVRMEARKKDWLRHLPAPFSGNEPRVFVAPIVAGEKVINSTHSPTWRFLRAHYGDAVAVEMEGHGFLKAMYARQYLNALVIRGISDLIDGKSEADAGHSQEIAAMHASAFAFELLTKLGQDSQSQTLDAPESQSVSPSDLLLPRLPALSEVETQRLSKDPVSSAERETLATDGQSYLRRGQGALFDGNYVFAQKQLVEAERAMSGLLYPEELAQVKYLQALAHLEGKRLEQITPSSLQGVLQLIEEAIKLHLTYSYVYTLALLRQATHAPELYQQIEKLQQQSSLVSWTLKDEENIQLLEFCQPYLSHIES